MSVHMVEIDAVVAAVAQRHGLQLENFPDQLSPLVERLVEITETLGGHEDIQPWLPVVFEAIAEWFNAELGAAGPSR